MPTNAWLVVCCYGIKLGASIVRFNQSEHRISWISTNDRAPLCSVSLLLPVLFTVGPLSGLESAGGVTLEVLPQAGTRGEPLPAGLALVGLLSSVDPLVVDQVPLRLKTRNF